MFGGGSSAGRSRAAIQALARTAGRVPELEDQGGNPLKGKRDLIRTAEKLEIPDRRVSNRKA